MLWAWCAAGHGFVARVDGDGRPSCCGNREPQSIAGSKGRLQRLEGHAAPGWLQGLLSSNAHHSRAELFNAVGVCRQAGQADAEIKAGLVRFGVQQE